MNEFFVDLLARGGKVDPPLVERYGEFPRHVHVDDLRSAVAARGYPLEQVPTADEGCVEYRSPVSDMHVLAVDPACEDQPDSPGTILKMLGPRAWWPWHRFAGREPELKRHAKELLPMSVAEIGLLVRAHGREQVTSPADEAVRRWLGNVPPVADLASARLLRNQIHEVRQGLPLLTDPGLAEAMRPWLKLRRNLLAD